MNYIVLDMEWNQPSFKTSKVYKRIGHKLKNEIMQIGAVKISEEFEIVDEFKINIRLSQYTKIHSRVQKLTNIKEQDIQSGVIFQNAANLFRRWCGENPIFITWGFDDIPVLVENLKFYNMKTDWTDNWYNLQLIFNYGIGELKKQKSLKEVVEYYSIEISEQLHDAFNDAYYTAQVFLKLDVLGGIANYDMLLNSFNESKSEFCGEFKSRSDAFEKNDIKEIVCPVCGRVIACDIEWVRQNVEKYIAMAVCPEHSYIIVRIKAIKKGENCWHLRRVVKEADEHDLELFEAKRKMQEEKNSKEDLYEKGQSAFRKAIG